MGSIRVGPDRSVTRGRPRGRPTDLQRLAHDIGGSEAPNSPLDEVEAGFRADFSPQSLWEIVRFFDEHCADGAPREDGLLAEETGKRLFAIGAYLGEVLRLNLGGEWSGDDADPDAEINVTLTLHGDEVVWPVQRAMKRMVNGPEDGLAAYGSSLGLQVGPARHV